MLPPAAALLLLPTFVDLMVYASPLRGYTERGGFCPFHSYENVGGWEWKGEYTLHDYLPNY